MSHLDPARAWKDAEYREALSAEEQASLPQNPAGVGELSDVDLGVVAGGAEAEDTQHILTFSCCGGFTTDPGFCSALCGPPPTYQPTFDYSCK